MAEMIYNPLEEYDTKFKNLHEENTKKFFEELVAQSGVNVEANRSTVKRHDELVESTSKLKRKRGWLRFWRVLMCITLILIPLVILKITPKIRALKAEIEEADRRAEALMVEAWAQMAPLNSLFTDGDAIKLIEKTIPNLDFAPSFSVEQESNMIVNFDFDDHNLTEQSTLDVLAGNYNGNPFVFENRLVHKMGVETYHGYKTIYWTETYRGSDGKTHTRTRSQTLHATLVKPKPFYHSQVLLKYCAQGGPELSFSRDATHLDRKSEKEIDRYVKRGEKKLKKKTDEAIKSNEDFVSMSNSDFEVLFDALDRTNEVQFRTLFTPLAQTNMVDLIRSPIGYGDDFDFVKKNRTNTIVSKHSQGRAINIPAKYYVSHSFDVINNNFLMQNTAFFKAVYFDFAPLWAIPLYQETPVHSLDPIPKTLQRYSYKECEALANTLDAAHVVHPETKTRAILKASYVGDDGGGDEICVSAYSYDIIDRLDFVPVLGGDGRWHNVPVAWDDYIPLSIANHFHVVDAEHAQVQEIIAQRNQMCIYH